MRVAQERENMPKLTLNTITNINSASVINSNFDKIKEELQNKVLYRDNPIGEPNDVKSTIDMNGKSIINAGSISGISGRFATIQEVEAIRNEVESDRVTTEASKIAAQVSADSANIAKISATSLYDLFDVRFLGAKSSEPTVDNDGNSLIAGAMYFALQLSPSRVRVYSGSAWQDVGTYTSNTVTTIDPSLYSTTTEAQDGTNDTKLMTPLKVNQAFTRLVNRPINFGYGITFPQLDINNQIAGSDTGLTIKSAQVVNGGSHREYVQFKNLSGTIHSSLSVPVVGGGSKFKVELTPPGDENVPRIAQYFEVNTVDGPSRTDDATTANGLVRKSQVDNVLDTLWFPGDTKNSYRTVDHGRWLLLTGASRTVGNASSGATARANADIYNLYVELWSNVDPLVTDIRDSYGVSTTRGGTAGADFNAGKRITLPNHSGLVIKGHHGGNGTFTTNTTRAFGSYEQDSILNHNHFFGLHIEGGSAPGPRGVIAASDRGGDNGGTANTDGSNNYGQNVGFYTSYVSSPGGKSSGENTVRTRSQNVFIYY
jgi:hypothetical protein